MKVGLLRRKLTVLYVQQGIRYETTNIFLKKNETKTLWLDQLTQGIRGTAGYGLCNPHFFKHKLIIY